MERTVSASLLCKKRMNVAQGLCLSTSILSDTPPRRFACDMSAWAGWAPRSLMQMVLGMHDPAQCALFGKSGCSRLCSFKNCQFLSDCCFDCDHWFFFCVQYQREFPLYHHVFNVSHSRGLFKNRSAVKATQAWQTINRGAPECHTVQRHVSAAGQMSSIFEIVLGELRACILSHSTRDRQQDVGGLCLTPLPSLKIVCGRKKDTKTHQGFLSVNSQRIPNEWLFIVSKNMPPPQTVE